MFFTFVAGPIGDTVFMGVWVGGNMGTAMFYLPDPNPPSKLFALTMGLLAEYKTASWKSMAESVLGWTGMFLGGGLVSTFVAAVYLAVVSALRRVFYGKMTDGKLRSYLLHTFICGFVLSASTSMFGLNHFDSSLWKTSDGSLLLIPFVAFIVVLWRQHVLNKRTTAQDT